MCFPKVHSKQAPAECPCTSESSCFSCSVSQMAVLLQWVHFFDFSPLCLFKCFSCSSQMAIVGAFGMFSCVLPKTFSWVSSSQVAVLQKYWSTMSTYLQFLVRKLGD